MIIANPIYDTVFKYLMEDTEIAKGMLSIILNVSQRYKTENDQKLNYENKSKDPLIEQILNRLTKAIADEDLRRKMNIEDEIERGYNMELQEIEIKLEAKLEEKYRQEIEALKRQIAQKGKRKK